MATAERSPASFLWKSSGSQQICSGLPKQGSSLLLCQLNEIIIGEILHHTIVKSNSQEADRIEEKTECSPLYLFSQVFITFFCMPCALSHMVQNLLRALIWPGAALYVQYVNADLSNSSAGGDISLLLISCIYSATLNSTCPLREEHHLHAHIWVFPLSLIGSVCVCADDGLLAV